jgi:putative glutamine amidotransferase
MLGFFVPMTPTTTSGDGVDHPRVGIPWRTSQEERDNVRAKLDYYFRAVCEAGAEPVEISLRQTPELLQEQLANLDGFVLPGSPADVDPARYGAVKHQKTNELDESRDSTDIAILDYAFRASKPVLAICYGCQLLNVYLHGTLIQDLPSERPSADRHGQTDLPPGAVKGDVQHSAVFSQGSRLARLNQDAEATINSSHHQAIDQPGNNLQITARAIDGTIEGVEWTGDANWVVGVQWHPERMVGDPFAGRLFADFVAAARAYSQRARGSVVNRA